MRFPSQRGTTHTHTHTYLNFLTLLLNVVLKTNSLSHFVERHLSALFLERTCVERNLRNSSAINKYSVIILYAVGK